MTVLFILLAMAVIALVAGVVTGRIGGSGLGAPASSSPFRGLPSSGVVPADLEALRFSAVVRGYRMDEVDQVLDQVAGELRRRDEEIVRLQAALDGQAHPESGGPAVADPADGILTVPVPPGDVPPVAEPGPDAPVAAAPGDGETGPDAAAKPLDAPQGRL